ncbi:FliM/FliN family flagellar motor switch protein [Roseateles chitinivorans]|uniref:FliM/FliN family flagellar motor switch protein n=1 Tax=Roseateles chitinivorans TaxID=2917965 RepID=UPI003D66404D
MNRPTSSASAALAESAAFADSADATTLVGRLPSMSSDDASLTRVAHDARFVDWLRGTLQHAGIGIARQREAMPWRLTIESTHGRFQIGLDAVDSPALQLACAHQPRDTACAIVTLLLAGWADAFAPLLGTLRVVDIEPLDPSMPEAVATTAASTRDGATASPRLVPLVLGGAMPIALLDADPAVLERVLSTVGASGVDLSPLAHLSMRPVIRLFARALPLEVLRGLRPGDTVLAGGPPALLRCGVGRALRASLHIDPQEFTVHLAEPPAISDDPAAYEAAPSAESAEAPQSAGSLDQLQLPVAFELDTARVSLAELASMQPGYAVELDVPLREATVRLVCHGRTLGTGQLIAIGDHLGVRITRLEFAHDAAAAR